MITKLKAIPSFRDLDDSLLAELADGLSFIRIEAGQELYHVGEPAVACYIISFGSMKLLKTAPTGKQVVVCFCRAGEELGAALMLSHLPHYALTATAIEDSGLIRIPREVYVEKWMNHPRVARAMHDTTFRRMIEFHEDKALASSSVPYRVANFLLRTLDNQPKEFGDIINMRLTRRDLAERLGTTVETVIRILSTWTQNGWIDTEDQRISVLNRSALEGLINAEAPSSSSDAGMWRASMQRKAQFE